MSFPFQLPSGFMVFEWMTEGGAKAALEGIATSASNQDSRQIDAVEQWMPLWKVCQMVEYGTS